MISERLGHASVAFTLQTYAHVIPAMDKLPRHVAAALILTDSAGNRMAAISGTIGTERSPYKKN